MQSITKTQSSPTFSSKKEALLICSFLLLSTPGLFSCTKGPASDDQQSETESPTPPPRQASSNDERTDTPVLGGTVEQSSNMPIQLDNLFIRTVSFPITGHSSAQTSKIKLLLVVDNSNSMRLVQEKLAASLDSLIRPLKNFQTEIKIITTSEIMKIAAGESLEAQGFSYRSWTFPVGSSPSTEEARILGAQPQETYGIYSYGEYHFLNSRYRIKFEPSDSQIDAKLSSLKQMILDISKNTGGSKREQGLCNLLLALHDRGPNQFFEKNDTAGVLLISDENDQSYWNNFDTTENRVACRNTYIHGNLEDKTIQKMVTSDSVNFNIFAARYQISYDTNNDGIIEKRSRSDNGGNPLPASAYANYLPQLLENKSMACPQDFFNNVIMKYVPYLIDGTNPVVSGCQVIPSWTALYNFAPESENICIGPFDQNGISYKNFADYVLRAKNAFLVPGSCSHYRQTRSPSRGFAHFYLTGSEDPETNRSLFRDLSLSKKSIKAAIFNQVERLFGKNKFFMGNLIHKENNCMVDSNVESLGTDYLNLFEGTPLADRIRSESLCTADFSPLLNSLAGGLLTSITRSYRVVDIEPYEQIVRVSIISGSTPRTLSIISGSTPRTLSVISGSTPRTLNPKEYSVKEGLITLDPSVILNTGDILIADVGTFLD